jgi:hypothetical protein
MGILFIAFAAFTLLIVGYAWKQLRSNWRSIQSMRSENKGNADASFDSNNPVGSDGSHHHGHCHDGMHHGAGAGGHDPGGFDVVGTAGSTEVVAATTESAQLVAQPILAVCF